MFTCVYLFANSVVVNTFFLSSSASPSFSDALLLLPSVYRASLHLRLPFLFVSSSATS